MAVDGAGARLPNANGERLLNVDGGACGGARLLNANGERLLDDNGGTYGGACLLDDENG